MIYHPVEPKRQSSPRRRTKLEKYRQERAAAANAGTPRGLNVADDDYYILIEVEELKYQLEVWVLVFHPLQHFNNWLGFELVIWFIVFWFSLLMHSACFHKNCSRILSNANF